MQIVKDGAEFRMVIGLDAESMLLGGLDGELAEPREGVGDGRIDGLLDLFEGDPTDLGGERRILRRSPPLKQNHGQERDLRHPHPDGRM